MDETVKRLFETACEASDEDYLAAEQALVAVPGNAAELVQLAAAAELEVDRFIARVLGQWAESGRRDYGEALAFLERQDRKFSSSPLGAPRWDLCARDLVAHYGDELSDFLALRLLKQRRWPQWMAMTAQTYLYDVGRVSSLPPLLRLAARTQDEDQRRSTLVTVFGILERARTPSAVQAGAPSASFAEVAAAVAEQAGEEGRVQGERRMLRLLLQGRLGELPAETASRLDAAALGDLRRWAERALSERRREAVLDGPGSGTAAK